MTMTQTIAQFQSAYNNAETNYKNALTEYIVGAINNAPRKTITRLKGAFNYYQGTIVGTDRMSATTDGRYLVEGHPINDLFHHHETKYRYLDDMDVWSLERIYMALELRKKRKEQRANR